MMEKKVGNLKKLNLGCGKDYREGWVNLDFNKTVKADVYCDIEKKLPFKDNTFDYVYADMVLEHTKDIFAVMDELYRICKPNAVIKIWVPHCSGVYALKHLAHYTYFGVGSFDLMCGDTFAGEKYNNAKFKILDERLIFWSHDSANYKWIYNLCPDFLFNFSRTWQQLMERFFPMSFDEITYKLGVIK